MWTIVHLPILWGWALTLLGSPWVAHAFTIGMAGLIDGTYTSSTYGLRPTINLKADVTITGEGTKDNPYQLV